MKDGILYHPYCSDVGRALKTENNLPNKVHCPTQMSFLSRILGARKLDFIKKQVFLATENPNSWDIQANEKKLLLLKCWE